MLTYRLLLNRVDANLGKKNKKGSGTFSSAVFGGTQVCASVNLYTHQTELSATLFLKLKIHHWGRFKDMENRHNWAAFHHIKNFRGVSNNMLWNTHIEFLGDYFEEN